MAADTNDSDIGSKIDSLGEHLEKIHSGIGETSKRLDAMEASHAKIGARLDKIERGSADDDDEAEEKERQDARAREDAKRRADGESDEERATRHEAEDAAWQAAGAERRDARKRARDAVKSVTRADSLSFGNSARFAQIQAQAEAAYQAWSKAAPPGLAGEDIEDYRVRLLTPLKMHSRLYGKSNLDTLVRADAAAFAEVERTIIADAIAASCSPAAIGPGALRCVEKRMPTGHIERRYYGDSAVTWAPFSGGGVQFVRFNQELARASQIATAGRR